MFICYQLTAVFYQLIKIIFLTSTALNILLFMVSNGDGLPEVSLLFLWASFKIDFNIT